MVTISNKLMSNYLGILNEIKQRRKKSFTQVEVCKVLQISRQKYSSFENGKVYDFILLDQVAGLVCLDLKLTYNEIY